MKHYRGSRHWTYRVARFATWTGNTDDACLTNTLRRWVISKIAAIIVRLVAVAGLLGLTGGCSVLLGIPDLGDPGNVASMKARFKATIQGQVRDSTSLDWGVEEQHIWRHYMGPRAVAFCGHPVNAPVTQRTYQINYFRGSFGNIDELEVDTPAHPTGDPSYDFCGAPRR